MFPLPEKVANAALDSHAGESFADQPVVMNHARAVVGEHGLAEIVQALATGKPAGGNNQRQIARFELLGLLDE